ncbi:MAG TPA: hypothetical protein VF753_14550 [Terriglobales bacterium]
MRIHLTAKGFEVKRFWLIRGHPEASITQLYKTNAASRPNNAIPPNASKPTENHMPDPEQLIDEILDDLIQGVEAIESRSKAILDFLKNKGIATDDELKPFLDQAASSSEVEWRAGRLRLHHLFVSAIQAIQKSAEDSAKKLIESSEQEPKSKENDKSSESRADDRPKEEPEPKSQKREPDPSDHPDSQPNSQARTTSQTGELSDPRNTTGEPPSEPRPTQSVA